MSEAVVSPRPTALSQGLHTCLECGQISRVTELPPRASVRCPACRSTLDARKPHSLSRTWALVLTGFILYIPANLFPIMTMDMVGSAEKDTIMSGVIELFQSGMWAIGLLVFCASITVPLMKLVGLTWLLISVQRGQKLRRRDRTRLYRVIEFIGRWSMLDVFLLSILVAVVNLGGLATITPDVGAAFFASVVVITMFAAKTFDPRLIWDAAETTTQSS